MDEVFRNRSPIGGQALSVGVLIRGRRNAAAYRGADGTIQVKTWPVKQTPISKTRRIPVIRGAVQMGSALSAGARTTYETVKMAKYADRTGNPIKRLLQYHGAEHKTIYCYEKGLDMTVENVKKQSRIHPRCGTSIAVTALMADAAMSAAMPKGFEGGKRDVAETIALLASIGISYELNRLAWTNTSKVAQKVTAPGRWAQNITTAEPDDDMIECAIAASLAAGK